MSELIIVHPKFSRSWKVINLECVQNRELSWKAKGLHTYLYSRPPGWRIHVNELVARSRDGRAATMSALRELKEAGYIIAEQCREQDGKFAATCYYIMPSVSSSDVNNLNDVEQATTVGRFSASGFSASGFSASGKSTPTNKEGTSKKPKKGEKTNYYFTSKYGPLTAGRCSTTFKDRATRKFDAVLEQVSVDTRKIISCWDRVAVSVPHMAVTTKSGVDILRRAAKYIDSVVLRKHRRSTIVTAIKEFADIRTNTVVNIEAFFRVTRNQKYSVRKSGGDVDALQPWFDQLIEVPNTQPELVSMLKRKWFSAVTGKPVVFTIWEYLKFVRASKRLAAVIRDGAINKIVPRAGEREYVNALFAALGDRYGYSRLTVGFLCSDTTFNNVLPAYIRDLAREVGR